MADIDYDSPLGQVRLLISDVQSGDGQILDDMQILGFLSLNDKNVRRAAADALDAIASSETLVSKVITTQDLQTDGSKVAQSLRNHADRLRSQANSDDIDDFAFDIVDTTPSHRPPPELSEPQFWGL